MRSSTGRGRPAAAEARVALAVGDLVWCFLDVSSGEVRMTLIGAARARVVEIDGDVHRVELLSLSLAPLDVTHRFSEGCVIEKPRRHLWAVADRREHAAFGEQIARFWPRAPCA